MNFTIEGGIGFEGNYRLSKLRSIGTQQDDLWRDCEDRDSWRLTGFDEVIIIRRQEWDISSLFGSG